MEAPAPSVAPRVRIYLDDRSEPIVDQPLPCLPRSRTRQPTPAHCSRRAAASRASGPQIYPRNNHRPATEICVRTEFAM
jgi:hypothetical protein